MYKLIVVEDEDIIRKGLVHTIDWISMGFSVVAEAENGQEGLMLILKHKPDLVISDIRMPYMNGLDMLALAKKEFNFQSIILTSYSEFEYAKKAISIGVSDYILKPIDEDELYKLIEDIKKKIDEVKLYEDIKKVTINKDDIDIINLKIYAESPDINTYVKYSLEKIKEDYSGKLSIEYISEELGVSSSYLSRKFKEEIGWTFLEILNKYRVQKAIEIILKDKEKYRVYEIADKVGFADYKHFCSVFKKYTNLTPKDFIKSKNILIK